MAGGFIGVVSSDGVNRDHWSTTSGLKKDAKSISLRISLEGLPSGVFQPSSDAILDGKGPLNWSFESEDSGPLAYEQAEASQATRASSQQSQISTLFRNGASDTGSAMQARRHQHGHNEERRHFESRSQEGM